METRKVGSSSLSYYALLGISSDSSGTEIRRAYHKLALQWHPDRWTRTPSLLSEAKQKFQQIQEAYSVLSDHKKRTIYDAGLYDPDDEEDEGFSEFMEEMVSLMTQVRREEKGYYSMEELQSLFAEMSNEFNQSASWRFGASILEDHCSKRIRLDKQGRI